jgi:TonB family protein
MITLIVEAALRSLALGLLVWLALAVARPSNPHLHKTVWISVVLASIAMPFLIGLRVAPVVPAPTYIVTLQSGTSLIAQAPAHWTLSATALYTLVALTLLVRFAIGLLTTWRIRANATVLREPWTQQDDVRVSLRLRSPATFGSTILLPPEFCEWSERKLAAVMSHERSHVHRKDCYILWIARLHTCLFWINPLAWWMQSRLAALAETTSDDAAVAELGDRPAYAEVLLEIAASHPATRLVTVGAEMAASEPHIATRIERIISGIAPSVAPKRRHQALAIAFLIPAVAVSAATLTPPVKLAQADMEPKLIDAGDARDLGSLERYYPPEAAHLGIEGLVTISISIDAQGRPTDTLILDETPLDAGFGASASALVHTFRYSNPRHQPTQLSIKVKFELKGGASNLKGLPPPQSPAGG